jgi:hypothetical protein
MALELTVFYREKYGVLGISDSLSKAGSQCVLPITSIAGVICFIVRIGERKGCIGTFPCLHHVVVKKVLSSMGTQGSQAE